MWRRLALQLRTITPARSAPRPVLHAGSSAVVSENLRGSFPIISRHLNAEAVSVTKSVENVISIVTGHELEELEAEIKGKDILEINYPSGPFGTKEEPAVVQSYYDKRIVGCPGADGEDEHDVVWFWLEKDKPHECPVCSQYFVLDVVGPGGPPDGHGDDDDDGHHH